MSKSKEQCLSIISKNFDALKIETDSSASLLLAIKKTIKEIYDTDLGLLYCFSHKNNELKVFNNEVNLNIPIEIEESLIEHVLLSKKGLFDNNVLYHKRYRGEIDNPLNIEIKSILIIPIFDKSKKFIIGFFSLFNNLDNSKEFERYEIRSLSLLEKYCRQTIELVKEESLNLEDKKLERKPAILKSEIKSKIIKTQLELELEEKIKIQEKRVEELEKKLEEVEKKSSQKMSLLLTEKENKLVQVLDFLTNEVTYLANEEHEIYLFLEIIKNSLHNKEQLNFIEKELAETKLITNLAQKLYRREKMPILFEEFNVFVLFSSVANLYSKSLSYRSITLNIFIDPKIPTFMISDIAKLRSLIIHLMNNVYGFVSEGGVVNFSVFFSSKESSLNIKIQSSMPNKLKQIKSFFQNKEINHSVITNDKGLGLSVCTNLINMLDGKLKLTTEGSDEHAFRAILPVKIVLDKSIQEFREKEPFHIAILMDDENEYAYTNLKKYLTAFNIPQIAITLFNTNKKMGNQKFTHLFCFENMLIPNLNTTYCKSVTILKYSEDRIEKKNLGSLKVNELMINSYYGMALQKILFPHLKAEELREGMILLEDSFLKKFNNLVTKLKL